MQSRSLLKHSRYLFFQKFEILNFLGVTYFREKISGILLGVTYFSGFWTQNCSFSKGFPYENTLKSHFFRAARGLNSSFSKHFPFENTLKSENFRAARGFWGVTYFHENLKIWISWGSLIFAKKISWIWLGVAYWGGALFLSGW